VLYGSQIVEGGEEKNFKKYIELSGGAAALRPRRAVGPSGGLAASGAAARSPGRGAHGPCDQQLQQATREPTRACMQSEALKVCMHAPLRFVLLILLTIFIP